MGFLTNAFNQRSVTVVPEEMWRKLETPVTAGVTVTPDTALTFSAVYAAHKIIAESVAMLPLQLFRRLKRGKEPAKDKKLYNVLHDVANPEMDSYLVRETMTAHLAGWGRAHAKIEYDANGEITALYPIPPNRVEVKRDPKTLNLQFEINLPDGGKKTYDQWQMLYLRGMSPDGITAYSPIKLARQGIGLALAAEAYGGSFFGNGAVPQGVIMHPAKMSEPAYNRLMESWEGRHSGIGNANKVAILEENAKYEKIGVPPDDAQFLESRTFQVQEIARWYRIPSMMLNMDGANSTYASVEAYGLQFVIYTLYPWLVRWEKGISHQLLLENERKKFFAEHLMSAILRGDTQSRYQAYATARQWGWFSVNDIRELENINPIEGGDVYLTPANMNDSAGERMGAQRAYLPVLTDAIARAMRREANDLRGGWQRVYQKRGAESFVDWMGEFYREHEDFIVHTLEPAVMSYAELVTEGEGAREKALESLRLFAVRSVARSQEQVKAALNAADPSKALDAVIDGWDAGQVAKMEISRHTAALLSKEPRWTS